MTRLRQLIASKILLAALWAVLGHLCIFSSSASAQRYMFGRADFATGGGESNSVATGDFNRDGILDLVFANSAPSVSILLGNADGTFQPPVEYTTGGSSGLSVAVGDFNGDHKLDLAVSNFSDNTVSIL